MIEDISYCANEACPLTDCRRHMKNLDGHAGIFSMSDFGCVCSTYLAYKDGEKMRDLWDYYLGDE